MPSWSQDGVEAAAVLGEVDRLRQGAVDRHAGGLEPVGELQGGLPAELDEHAGRRGRAAGGCLGVVDLEDVLEGERLEVQPVGGVVVGRDRLGVAVDHDGLVAGLAQGVDRVDAAVVELDALPDAVRARRRG
jgi:hypothetical protein